MTLAAPTPQRLLLVGGVGVAALFTATGAVAYGAFDQPSPGKYAVTVAGVVLLLAVAVLREPLRAVFPLIVVAAPFADFETTIDVVSIPAIWPLLLLGAVAAMLGSDPVEGRSALGAAGLWLVALLAVPLLGGSAIGENAGLLAAMLLVAWLAAQLCRRPGGLEQVMGAVVLAAVVQAVIALWQQRTGQQLNLYGAGGGASFGRDYFFQFGDENRPTGSFADPISLGNALALALPFSIVLATRARGLLDSAAFSLAGLLIALALALSLSRMSWIGAIVGVLACLALLPRGARLQAALGVAAIGVAVVVLAIGTYGPELGDRFQTALDPTSQRSSRETGEGDRIRLRLWHSAMTAAGEHPAAGVGFGNIRDQLGEDGLDEGAGAHAHSTYLQVAAEAGLLGVLALLIVGRALLVDLRGARRAHPLAAAGLAGAVVAVLVTWLTDYAIGYLPVAVTVAIAFGAVAGAGGRIARRA